MFNVQGLFFIGKSTLARIKCKCKNKFKKGFRIYSHQQINACNSQVPAPEQVQVYPPKVGLPGKSGFNKISGLV